MGRGGTYVSGMGIPYSDPIELGLAIERARKNANLTLKALGEMVGSSDKRLGRMEKGDIKTLGETEGARFKTVAPIAAATGDLSLIGLEELGDRAELVSLRRDVDRLDSKVRQMADLLVGAGLAETGEIDRLLDPPSSTAQPPTAKPPEAEGQTHG